MSTKRTAGRLIGLVLATAVWLAACASSPEFPEEAAYMRGEVVSVMHHATASGFLVKGMSSEAEPCDLQAVADADTRYFRRTAGGDLEPAERAEVDEGARVEVHVDGDVMETCPLQGRAAAFVLTADD